jgi:NADP-dependent aldehyde dehydrogenase
MQLAESREVPIPFFGELGSINPLVVSPSAARRRGTEITRDYLASITLGAGQFCTKPALAFVPSDSGEEIKSVLAEALSSVPQMFLLTEAIQRTFEQGVQRLTDESGIERVAAARVVGPGYEVSPAVFWTTMGHFRQKFELLTKECFGPSAVLVTYDDPREVICALKSISGTLTMSLHAEAEETEFAEGLLAIMTDRAGRIVWNGFPTGVAVSWAMTHGGPWPATTSPMHTSVGATAIRRFLRPVTFQDVPGHLLPVELRDGNPAAIPRRVNGILTTGGELT